MMKYFRSMYQSKNKDFKAKVVCAFLNLEINQEEAKYLLKNGFNIPINEWATNNSPTIDLLNKIGLNLPKPEFVC